MEVFNCMRTRFLPGLLALLAEAGGSALPIADTGTAAGLSRHTDAHRVGKSVGLNALQTQTEI